MHQEHPCPFPTVAAIGEYPLSQLLRCRVRFIGAGQGQSNGGHGSGGRHRAGRYSATATESVDRRGSYRGHAIMGVGYHRTTSKLGFRTRK